MVFRHPIILVTIPVALVLGLIWFKRKKVHRDSADSDKASSELKKSESNGKLAETNETIEKRVDLKHSISLPIGSTPKKYTSPILNNNDSFDFKCGKSAPIDVTPHEKSPTRKTSDTKEKEEVLNSIEENSLDSVDLPGSVNCRRRFTIRTNEPAIVVKAANMDVEKSPQSSFETLTTSSPTEAEILKSTKMAKTPSEKKSKTDKQTNGINKSPKENKKPERSLPVASPPLSLCSNKSLDSGDSGKGSSPANSEGGALSPSNTYDFQLAQTLVGFIVGKQGSIIKKIREDSHVGIAVRRHPFNPKKYKLVTLQGTQEQINQALAIIKTKLPPKVNIDRIDLELESAELLAAMSNIDSSVAQLNLIDGINNDVSICTVISAGHLFLQQPLHPSYPSLNLLQSTMNQSYSSYESPPLPAYNASTICVGHIDGHYYRLQIINYSAIENACLAKYLDYGGYCRIATTELKQIRADFMSVLFQAIECRLGDIRPKGGEWSLESTQVVTELTQFRSLQAQVVGYSESGLPEIYLYSEISPNNVVFINQELVARGLAEWYSPEPIEA